LIHVEHSIRDFAASWRYLLVALGAVGFGLAAVYFNGENGAPLASITVRAGVAYALTVVAVMASLTIARFDGDRLLLPITTLLAGIGLIMAIRLQPDLLEVRGLAVPLGERQLAYLLMGFLLIWATALIAPSPESIARYRYTILLSGLALLAVTAVVGTDVNGARLWLSIGPLQFQTAELVKVVLVVFLAAYLADHQDLVASSWRVWKLSLPPLPYLAPMAVMWGLCLVMLVALNDLGTALLFFALFLVMLYAATGRVFDLIAGMAAFAIGATVALLLFHRVQTRIDNWIDPWHDPFGVGDQPIQSDFAIASGGIFGAGLGEGRPWLIPEVQTDYVFSAIAEELGLIGVIVLLGLYVALTGRGLLIARRRPDAFGKLLATGLTASLSIQAIIILAGVLRLMPLTGVTLPFVSYGGSSILVSCLTVGLLLRLSASPTPLSGRVRSRFNRTKRPMSHADAAGS
jgi:cell division protein FtsW (lipid II flippase)